MIAGTTVAAEIVDRYEELREQALKLEPVAGLAVLINQGMTRWVEVVFDSGKSAVAPKNTNEEFMAVNSKETAQAACSEIVRLLANMVVGNQSGVNHGR